LNEIRPTAYPRHPKAKPEERKQTGRKKSPSAQRLKEKQTERHQTWERESARGAEKERTNGQETILLFMGGTEGIRPANDAAEGKESESQLFNWCDPHHLRISFQDCVGKFCW